MSYSEALTNANREQLESTNTLFIAGDVDAGKELTELRLADGRISRLPTSLLLESMTRPSNESEDPLASQIVIPVFEEQLEIHKQSVETGKVILEKHRHEIPKTIDETLAVSTYQVERVQCNVLVDVAPSARQEGDTTIYPVIEERLVVSKQLVLTEEVRVTRVDSEKRDTRVIQIIREEVTVERRPADSSTSGPSNLTDDNRR